MCGGAVSGAPANGFSTCQNHSANAAQLAPLHAVANSPISQHGSLAAATVAVIMSEWLLCHRHAQQEPMRPEMPLLAAPTDNSQPLAAS